MFFFFLISLAAVIVSRCGKATVYVVFQAALPFCLFMCERSPQVMEKPRLIETPSYWTLQGQTEALRSSRLGKIPPAPLSAISAIDVFDVFRTWTHSDV